jgi:hypothetical protein
MVDSTLRIAQDFGITAEYRISFQNVGHDAFFVGSNPYDNRITRWHLLVT